MAASDDEHGTESEYTETEDLDDHVEEIAEGSAAEGAKRKRKKKKKKKKSVKQETPGEAPGDEAVDKGEADRRFHKAMDSVKQGEDMWVLLGACNIFDGKARKLFDALHNNRSVTSVNLSANHISDDGVRAIVGVLEAGGAPELIGLDLRGNPVSDAAIDMLAKLQKQRKHLRVESGPLQPPSPPPTQPGSPPPGASGSGAGAGAAGAGAPGGDFRQGQLFRRYFQGGGDDEDGGGGDDDDADGADATDPQDLWSQLRELVERGQEAIPALSQVLHSVSTCLEKEIPSVPPESDVAITDLRPHFRAAVEQLPLLARVLRIEPRPCVTQSSPNLPQPAAGSHRVWVADVVMLLMLPANSTIGRCVAEAGLLPTMVALALRHTCCSALQCRVLSMLRSAVHANVGELWQQLLAPAAAARAGDSGEAGGGVSPGSAPVGSASEPSAGGSGGTASTAGVDAGGAGADGAQAGASTGDAGGSGSDVGGSSDDAGSCCRLEEPLHLTLVRIAAEAAPLPMGQRSAAAGFATEAAEVLLVGCDPGSQEAYSERLAQHLDGCVRWLGATEPGGELHHLLQERDGELCGPKPLRIESQEESDSFVGLPPGLVSGPNLYQLLKESGISLGGS